MTHCANGHNEVKTLLPQHAALIQASAISDAVAQARGYYSAETKTELRRLSFSAAQCLTPALVLPVWGVDGEIVLHQARPDAPRLRDGKPVKYETPTRARMALDVHPLARPLLGNPDLPLFITEGLRKADAAVTLGLCCIALLGVWNWRGSNEQGGLTALADWEHIALKGRKVYVAFDSDVMEKPEVYGALERLKAFLERRGAAVLLIYLPAGDGGAKVGLDDYIAAGHGVADLLALATPTLKRPTTDTTATDEKTFLLSEAADDEGNAQCVNRLYGDQFLYTDAYGYLRYADTHWEMKGADEALDRAVVKTLKQRQKVAVEADRQELVKYCTRTAKRVRDTIYLFRSLRFANVSEFDNNPDLLNCRNGVIDLRTGDLLPHDPAQRFTYCVPVEYDPARGWDEWAAFLRAATHDDNELQDYLQMAVGYSLTGHTSEECLWYLHGPTRAGKGTFTETLLTLLPKPIGVQADFATFTDRRDGDNQNFDLAPLKPARLVIASESNKYQSLNVAKIKQMTGGDWIRCAFKHRDHFEYRPQFKIWLVSNHPVNADVDDDAAWYRLKVIEFPNSFAGREDKELKQRIKEPESLQAVLNWAVVGAIMWYGLGPQGLQTPARVQAYTQKGRDALDFVKSWLDECCEDQHTNPDAWTSNERLYTSYENWCKANGVKPKEQRGLSMSLKGRGYETGVQQWSQTEAKNQKGVKGLVLR